MSSTVSAKLVVVVPVAVIAGMDALVDVGQTERPLERFPSGHQGVVEVAAHLGEDLPVRPRAGDWRFLQHAGSNQRSARTRAGAV
jgi:hypothetical protein